MQSGFKICACVCSRLQRTSKVRALDQVKAWCGAEDEPTAKKVKREVSSEEDDYSDHDSRRKCLHLSVNVLEKIFDKRIEQLVSKIAWYLNFPKESNFFGTTDTMTLQYCLSSKEIVWLL